MAAGKIFAISFAINAMMGASFGSAMSRSSAAMQQLKSQTAYLKAEQGRLNRVWQSSKKEVNTYGQEMQRLRQQYEAGKISESQYRYSVEKISQSMKTAGMSVEEYRGHLQRLRQESEQTQATMTRMRTAQAAKSSAGANFSASQTGFISTAATIGMAAAPVMGMVETAMSFEASMSKVQAITGATGADFQALTAKARELGSTTQFSASQSAEAMTYLGMAGWKTEQIVDGMPGLLNLAAASGENLATTADIVSDGLTAFNMKAGQAKEMADVMAAASSNANTNVSLMGETFKYCAPVAGALGYSLQDTTIAIGLMANAGIKGSNAGTALRATMTRLVAPPKEAAEALGQLGISAVNSDGSMKPLRTTIAELREKFAGLSEAEKSQKAASIAGQDAMSGFLAIINASEKDVNSLTAAIDNSSGKALEMSKTMSSNAKGAITQLQSAVEGLAISVGTVFLPGVTNAARATANMAGEAAVWAEENEDMVRSIGEIAAAVASAVIAIKGYRVASSAFTYARTSVELYLETLRYTTTGQKALTIATNAQTKAITLLKAATNGNVYRQLGTQAAETFARMRALTWTQIGTQIKTGISSGTVSATGAFTRMRTTAKMAMISAKNSVINATAIISARAVEAGQSVSTMSRNFNMAGTLQRAGAGLRAFGTAIMSIGKASLAAMFSPLGIAIMAIAGAAYLVYNNWDSVGPFFMELWGRIQEAFNNAWQSIQPAIENLQTAFGGMMETLGPRIQSVGNTLIGAFDQISMAVAANSGTFDMLVNIATVAAEIFGGSLIGSFIIFANISVGVITTAIGIISSVITGAIGVFTGLIEFITGVFSGNWSVAWQGIVDIFSNIFNTLQGIIDSVLGGIGSTVSGIANSVSSIIGGGNAKPVEARSNARGGIYQKGAFLTTFAEESPEAAIPLDGSPRAIGLWRMAGQILGIGNEESQMPGDVSLTKSSTAGQAAMSPIAMTLNFYGNAEPAEIKKAVLEAGEKVQKSFNEQMEAYKHERGRLSFG